jgi:hypothetical protein
MRNKNLKPFKKNDPRINKGGRPKWKHLTEMLKNEENQDKLEELVRVVYDKALSGDMRAVEFIADRLEGRVATRITVDQPNDQPIKVFDIEGLDDDLKPVALDRPTRPSEK